MDEIPFYIPVNNGEHMFAILTLPAPDVPDQHTGIILTLGNFIASFARNRMYRRAAAALAAHGYHVLRVDYRGNGDHSVEIPNIHAHAEFGPDFIEMARFFMEHATIERLVMVGSCFSSRAIIEASDQIAHLDGVVLFSTPLVTVDPPVGNDLIGRASRKVLRTVARRIAPISEAARTGIYRLLDNGIPVLMIYGANDNYYKQEFLRSGLDAYRSPAGHRLELIVYPGQVHDFPSITIQETLIQKLVEWIPARHGAPVAARAGHKEKEEVINAGY
jgi:pimeloyl-ACP methyl ester carboxylesterase